MDSQQFRFHLVPGEGLVGNPYLETGQQEPMAGGADSGQLLGVRPG